MADQSQKTEKPTEKRLRKAREDGQFASSREFLGAVQFLAAVVILVSWGPAWFKDLQHVLRHLVLVAFKRELSIGDLTQIGWTAALYAFLPIFKAGAVLVLLTLGLQLGLTRFGFSLGRLKPKWNKVSPMSKLKSLPKQNLFATIQTLVTLVVCCLALYIIARRSADEFQVLRQAGSGLIASGAGSCGPIRSEVGRRTRPVLRPSALFCRFPPSRPAGRKDDYHLGEG